MTLAPRTLASLATPKPKISLQFLFRRGVWGEPAKNGKENFWFWFRRFIPPERTCIYILALWRYFVRPFLRHSRRCEALPYPRLVVVLVSAHTSQPPRIGRSHSLTMPARCLLRVRSVASFESVVALKSGLCWWHKQIYMCLPRPPIARTENHSLSRVAPLLAQI
jgi:hypothetical protein